MTHTILSDTGIITDFSLHGETGAIIKVFSHHNGLISGYCGGAISKKKSGIYQKGNIISFEHNRKHDSYLGNFTAESIGCLWYNLSHSKFSFYGFTAICDILNECLAYYVPEESIYESFLSLAQIISTQNMIDSGQKICLFLVELLGQLGFSPDLYCCGVTGQKENLYYVSPKTGRAISHQAGKNYHNKLLLLPEFMYQDTQNINQTHIKNGIKLCGFLFEKYIFMQKNKPLPHSFIRFFDVIL